MAITTRPVFNSTEARDAKSFYDGSDIQPVEYGDVPPPYCQVVTQLITSRGSGSVLEFGCNAGRNLDVLRKIAPHLQLTGVDLNQRMIEHGRALYGLDLLHGDENWLADQPDDAFDISFTVSVLDHIPHPEPTILNLLRITSDLLVLFEISYDRLGKAASYATAAANGEAYPFSYVHDYRFECERKLGATCILDVHFPIGDSNLHDLYRLFVFKKAGGEAPEALVKSIVLQSIVAS